MKYGIFAAARAVAAVGILYSANAMAAGGHNDGHGHGKDSIGAPGKASEIDKVIKIDLFENYYDPRSIKVHAGETIKFVVVNKGELVHEFNIGTTATHAAHQEEMMGMIDSGVLEADRINHAMMDHGSGMKHDDPNSVLLEPGKSGEVIWKFAKESELEFACNVPGHYESGMVGKFEFEQGH